METRIHTAFVFGEVGSAKSHEDAICKFNEIEKTKTVDHGRKSCTTSGPRTLSTI